MRLFKDDDSKVLTVSINRVIKKVASLYPHTKITSDSCRAIFPQANEVIENADVQAASE